MKHLKKFEGVGSDYDQVMSAVSENNLLRSYKIKPGMIGYCVSADDWSDNAEKSEAWEVIEVKNIGNFRNQDIEGFKEYLEDYSDWTHENIIQACKKNFLSDTDYMVRIKKLNNDYVTKIAVLYYGFNVPESEQWKEHASGHLIKKMNDTGILEGYLAFDKAENWLPAEEVTSGMIAYDAFDNMYQILEIKCFDKVTDKEVKKYGQAWNDFLEIAERQRISVDDYYILVREVEPATMFGTQQPAYERFAIYGKNLKVPVSEKWKSSKMLKDTNQRTGIFEKVVVKDYLEAFEVKPGMHAVGIDDEVSGEVVGIWKISDLLNMSLFKEVQKMSDTAWLSYEYEEHFSKSQNVDTWRMKEDDDAHPKMTNVADFLERNSLKKLTYDDYLICIKTKCNIFGVCSPSAEDFTEVFPYGEEMKVPTTERWKSSNKLKSTSDKIGILEGRKHWLSPLEVKKSMIGKFTNGYDGEVIDIIKIADVTDKEFKRLQNISKSKWLTTPKRQDQTDDDVESKIFFTSLKDVVDYYAERNITSEDYFVIVKSQMDMKSSVYPSDLVIDVFLYREKKDKNNVPFNWKKHYENFRVPVTERWKSSDKIRNANDKLGILD